ncbi:hypothetical protein BJ508DRAFT_313038 [Ascobolus immersus RN42]|uniref:Uncharacterized protein n=1 Tax=Ascobolus immersus RN42 TaxID=1160509 RepID=A0A3N4HX80_ASCIM|nr:hypothetical protein BJ508DRAFT_313038 [Ascobolus immersus RN42]
MNGTSVENNAMRQQSMKERSLRETRNSEPDKQERTKGKAKKVEKTNDARSSQVSTFTTKAQTRYLAITNHDLLLLSKQEKQCILTPEETSTRVKEKKDTALVYSNQHTYITPGITKVATSGLGNPPHENNSSKANPLKSVYSRKKKLKNQPTRKITIRTK